MDTLKPESPARTSSLTSVATARAGALLKNVRKAKRLSLKEAALKVRTLGVEELFKLEETGEAALAGFYRYANSLGAQVTVSVPGRPTVLTFYNHAGGAGKTTLSRDIGYGLSLHNLKVLAIDLDPQHSLTSSLGLDVEQSIQLEHTIYRAIAQGGVSDRYPVFKAHGMDVIPACIELDRLQGYLASHAKAMPQFRLRAMTELLSHYDVVVIDCPSSMGDVASLGILAADHLIVPVTPDPKGLVGAKNVVGYCSFFKDVARHLTLSLFVPTQVDKRFTVQKEGLARLFQSLETYAPVAPPLVCRKSLYDAAWVATMPAQKYNPKHQGVKELNAVTDLVLSRIGVTLNVTA